MARGSSASPGLLQRAAVAFAVCLACCRAASAQQLEFGNKTHGWVEVISWRPRALVLHGFLTHAECDHLVAAAQPSLQRSMVVANNGSGVLDQVRTSSGTFLAKGLDATVADIEARVATATHLPVSHAENLQVLKYELGQEYRAHWDTIEVGEEAKAMFANQRSITVLMYLSDVEEGGETTFPAGTWLDQGKQVQHPYSECGSQGTAVKPRKGDALLFHNLKPSAKVKDAFSYHAGCPVIRGTKYSATSWIHVAPFGGAELVPAAGQAPGAPAPLAACRDNNSNCGVWAEAGECEANPIYMRGDSSVRGNCRLSCKVCRPCHPGDVVCERENIRSLPQRERAAAAATKLISEA